MKVEKPKAAEVESVSFLVRFWRERQATGAAPVLRGFVRNLKTGEERYLAGPDQLSDHVRRTLEGSETRSATDAGDRERAGA